MKYAILYTKNGTKIEPVENSCRQYHCCNGESCGFTLSQVKSILISEVEQELGLLKSMSLQQIEDRYL